MGRYYKPINRKALKKIKNQRNVLAIIIEDDEKLIGLAVISIIRSLTKKTLTIEDFIISKKYRRKGYGRQLLEKIIKIAKSFKVDCIEVQTKQSNKVAQNIYRQYGFRSRRQTSMRKWLK